MDGVFMKKIIKLTACIALLAFGLGVFSLLQDKQVLQDELLRLHVVGNSNSAEDQQIKLQLKDAIVTYLQPIVEKIPTKQEAVDYIRKNLDALEAFSNRVLDSLGVIDRAKVSLQPEKFDTRAYDTFTLPAGVYDALRVEIGAAEGKNWWCVVFPSLCLPATTEDFQDTAVGAGFSGTLTDTISGEKPYEIRFFFLDWLGQLENFLFRR